MHRSMNNVKHDLLVKQHPYISREDLLHNRQFISDYQKAVLFSLFEKNQITKHQYERCLERIKSK